MAERFDEYAKESYVADGTLLCFAPAVDARVLHRALRPQTPRSARDDTCGRIDEIAMVLAYRNAEQRQKIQELYAMLYGKVSKRKTITSEFFSEL